MIEQLDLKTIRELKNQLCSMSVIPNGSYFGVVHPYYAPKICWTAGRYCEALKFWFRIWKTWNMEAILKSTPWSY